MLGFLKCDDLLGEYRLQTFLGAGSYGNHIENAINLNHDQNCKKKNLGAVWSAIWMQRQSIVAVKITIESKEKDDCFTNECIMYQTLPASTKGYVVQRLGSFQHVKNQKRLEVLVLELAGSNIRAHIRSLPSFRI